jgi:hypothetical protein
MRGGAVGIPVSEWLDMFSFGDVPPTPSATIGGGDTGKLASLPTGGIGTVEELERAAYDAGPEGPYLSGGGRRRTRRGGRRKRSGRSRRSRIRRRQ